MICRLLLGLVVLCAGNVARGDLIAQYSFAGLNGGESTATATYQVANIDASAISRSAGLFVNFLPDSFTSERWTNASVPDLAADFLTFTIKPVIGYKVSFTNLQFSSVRRSQGPKSFELRSSVDGYQTPVVTFGSTTTNEVDHSLDLSGKAEFQSVIDEIEFRIYGFASGHSTHSDSRWSLIQGATGGFVVNGTVQSLTAIPEPSAPLLCGLASLLVGSGYALRRRFV